MLPQTALTRTLCLSLLGLMSFNQLQAAPKSVTVEAGASDRQNCVVTFPWKEVSTTPHRLKAADGRLFPLQTDGQGHATFLLDKLTQGTSLKLTLESAANISQQTATASKAGSAIVLTSQGKTVLNYQTADTTPPRPDIKPVYSHNSYLHPILTPGGKLVTGDYPPDHLWHRGIWLAWTHTEFDGAAPDFWNQGKDNKLTARIDFNKLDSMWSGEVHAGFRSQHRFLEMSGTEPKPVLNETWEVRVYALPASAKLHVFDLTSVQSCATDKPLKLPKYYYGGLGFRGNRQWEEKDNFSLLLSNGETDRVKANEQRIHWIHLSGKTDGELAGICIMDHPGNFTSPQPIRVNPKNPQTCFAPSQLDDWSIEPGKPLTLRYRFVVSDGAPDKTQLDALYRDFAEPPIVRVK